MPSLKTIWENSMIKKHPIWTVIGIVITSLILYIQSTTSFFAGWGCSESLDLVSVLLIAITLLLQSKSVEKTARMEMAKVLTEAFSHSEMYDAIRYFLQVSPDLVDENGKDRKDYIKEINEKPETKRYRYRLLTTLHHAERLYKTEKADKILFNSLITPDIVEVTLSLYKLDDFMKAVDKSVYEMVYKVFEDIRTSYLEPYWYALENKTPIDAKQIKHTRRILKNLQAWDKQWGNEGDRILTEKDLKLLEYLKYLDPKSDKAELREELVKKLNEVVQRFEAYQKETKKITKPEAFSELYYFRANIKYELKDYKGANEDCTKAIELKPDFANAYNNRGVTRGKLNDYKGAIKDCTKAIELKPDFANAYYNRGLTKAKLNNYDGAIKNYTKAININKKYTTAYGNRGFAYWKIGKQAEADKDFAEYKRLTEGK